MALEALTQQDQLDARFARAFSPIDRLGTIPVSIAELNLARQRDETSRLQKLFDTVQEQTFRSTENKTERTARADENKAYREYARETMNEQQKGIDVRNEKLEKLRRETDLEERKINTETFNELSERQDEISKKIAELYQVPISVRNQAARKVAETVVKDKKILDRDFRLDSATDNSNNLGKIPGGEMLDGEYQKAIAIYQFPRIEEAKGLQRQFEKWGALMVPLAAHMDLRGASKEGQKRISEGAATGEQYGPKEMTPFEKLMATKLALDETAAKAVAAESTPIQNTALGIPPLNQISKGIGSVIGQVGQDLNAINPARGLGSAIEHIVTGSPMTQDTPDQIARQQRIFTDIGRAGSYGIGNVLGDVLMPPTPPVQPAQALPRFPSVSPAGPFGMPLNDSEIPGLRMLLKEGVNGQMFGEDQISLFFNEARRNPGGNQMKAIQLLREKLMKRSAGIPDVPTEAAPYGGPSSLFSPVPALRDFVFPITPLPR